MIYDFCVVGGGIVGLATAREILKRFRGASLILLEKEDELSAHQTGRNSGVVHAGVYYRPGSLKAQLCIAGAQATKQYTREHNIPFDQCGKLIVATDNNQIERLAFLRDRATQNGIGVQWVTASELRELEPDVAGVGAVLVPTTAITDYRAISRSMADEVSAAGGEVRLGQELVAISEGPELVEISTHKGTVSARRLVACAGLQSDRIARLAGLKINHAIVPFRGEYFSLNTRLNSAVKHLIYPAPDPSMPFLGIHLTRMIDGTITVGPNAMLGMAREGYARLAFDVSDFVEMLRFPGFWRAMAKNARHATGELKNSLFRRAYLEECRKYLPQLQLSDLTPHPAGIRAQAVLRDGSMADDFLFLETPRSLHVCNAPSPAATSAIPIAGHIVSRLEGR